MKTDLFKECKEIITENEKKLRNSGILFNLISILGMEHYEARTHSKILGSLFDNNKRHSFGNKFLDAFLKEIEITNFDTSDYSVILEEYVGEITCSDGTCMRTFLDIVIKENKTGNVILIENKIWAKDQFEQLERYFECYKEKIIKLIYLNVFEKDYRFSLENLDREKSVEEKSTLENIKKVFKKISYEKDVKNWLEKCQEISTDNNFVHSQIKTYYQTILNITNQNEYQKMNTDLKNKITEDIEDFDAALEIAKAVEELNNIGDVFYGKLIEKISTKEVNFKFSKAECKIGLDEDPLWLGFRLHDNVGNTVKDDIDFNETIKRLKNDFPDNQAESNDFWNVWFHLHKNNPMSEFSLLNLTSENKIYLYKNMDKAIDEASQDFGKIIEKLKEYLL